MSGVEVAQAVAQIPMDHAIEIASMSLKGSKAIGAGIAMSGAIGAGIGLGIYLGGYVNALARNPGAAKELNKILYVGIGVIEAIAIFATGVALIDLFL